MNYKNITKKMSKMFCVSVLLFFSNSSYGMILQTLQQLNSRPPEDFVLRPGEGLPGGFLRSSRDLEVLSILSRKKNPEWLRTVTCEVSPVRFDYGWGNYRPQIENPIIEVVKLDKGNFLFFIARGSGKIFVSEVAKPNGLCNGHSTPKENDLLYDGFLEAFNTGFIPITIRDIIKF